MFSLKKSFLCIGLDVDLQKIPAHLLNEDDPIFAFNKAIIDATKNAIETPLEVMQVSCEAYGFLKVMAQKGNPNSVSDAGVGALACRAAVHGAYLNVKINCAGFEDEKYVEKIYKKADRILKKSDSACAAVLKIVEKVINN